MMHMGSKIKKVDKNKILDTTRAFHYTCRTQKVKPCLYPEDAVLVVA